MEPLNLAPAAHCGQEWSLRYPLHSRRIPWARAGVLLASAATLAACAEEPAATDSWAVEVDTVAGILHVTNVPPASGPAVTLHGVEEMRVGSVTGSGPDAFGHIRSLALLPDGRFAVADGQPQEVRVFAADGAHQRTFGGEGEGPGDLAGLQGVMTDPDGLLRVPEQGNARMSLFDPDSGFVSSLPLRFSSHSGVGPWDAVVDPAGRWIVDSSGQFGEGRFWSMVRIYDPDMQQTDSVPYYDYTDDFGDDVPGAWFINLGNGASTWARIPFYPQPWQTLTSRGQFWSTTGGSPLLEAHRWTPTGDTLLTLRSQRRPAPVTVAERDSAMKAARDRLEQMIPTPPSLNPAEVPDTKPPVFAISVDDGDRLWVRLTEHHAAPTVYDVFDLDGRHVETVELPGRVDRYVPPTIVGDRVWAVVIDELDVQSVVRYRLVPDPDAR